MTKNKLINHFKVLGLREEKQLQEWFDNQVGTRRAKLHTEKGFEKYVVQFITLEKFKSLKQNRTFHGLLSLFFRSGCYSCDAKTFDELKRYYKKQIGLIKCYVYFDGYKIVEVKNKSDIPKNVDLKACRIILESFSKATKKQAREGIDLIKTEMLNSKIGQTTYANEFYRILDELDKS